MYVTPSCPHQLSQRTGLNIRFGKLRSSSRIWTCSSRSSFSNTLQLSYLFASIARKMVICFGETKHGSLKRVVRLELSVSTCGLPRRASYASAPCYVCPFAVVDLCSLVLLRLSHVQVQLRLVSSAYHHSKMATDKDGSEVSLTLPQPTCLWAHQEEEVAHLTLNDR